MKYSLSMSNFLEEILVFPILLFSSVSLHWSQRKDFLSLLAILWNSAFKCLYLSFSPLLFFLFFFYFIFKLYIIVLVLPNITSLLFTAICKASSDSHFALFHFFSMRMVWSLSPLQCHKPQTIVHQALSLSDLVPKIYFSLPLHSHKGFDLGHTWTV